MTAHTAERFAQSSLALYGDEVDFSMGVDDEDDVEEVARAFERLGCAVQREPLRLRVVVRVSPRER